MKVVNRVIPNEEQIKGFFEAGPEGPIYMVNLLKFKPVAEYEDGRSTQLTGKEAYEIYGDAVAEITAPGRIEGGDILITEREVLVGLSARTDTAGVELLRIELDRLGHDLRVVEPPEGVLHFKTDCSLLDPETVLSTERLAASGCFKGYKVLHVAEGEEAAANAIRFNDVVVMAKGFPRTEEMLDNAGYEIRQIGNTEAAKLDGGMSCLSLRIARA